MMRAHLNKALLVSAAMLLTSSAFGQSPNANPQGKGHAADEAKKAAAAPGEKKADDKKPEEAKKAGADEKAKGDDKGKADEKAKGDEKGKSGDHASRVAKQHEDQKAKLLHMLKGPMDAPVKEELRRHAERVARIERIKNVATDAKDTDAADRAGKLLAKENARHDKWMEKHVAGGAAAMPAAVAPTAAPAAPAASAPKGDMK